jgi:hypothetical protein
MVMESTNAFDTLKRNLMEYGTQNRQFHEIVRVDPRVGNESFVNC